MTTTGRLTRDTIDASALVREVAGPSRGAIILFLGVVRELNEGRGVTGIEYSAYEGMAAMELRVIADEAGGRFDASSVAIVHRLGELSLEEVSVGIAVAHGHRGEAYEVSRWVIEELKRRVPIWKREHYVDGTREWVDPTGRRTEGATA
ncbi:MAG: molybdenum cofactor biosynthesis protein MoaE [Gemmatimonadaceae bacterium]